MKIFLKTKLILQNILALIILMQQSQLALASNRCEDWADELLQIQTEVKYYELKPGEEVFGFFTCSSCGTRNSAKPNEKGDQKCTSCSNPHDDQEAFEPPMHITKGGKIFIIDPKVVLVSNSKDKAFSANPLWNCPFCSSTNSLVKKGCSSCGAQIESDINSVLFNNVKAALNPQERRAMQIEDRNEVLRSKYLQNEGAQARPRAFLTSGGVLLAIIGAGVVWWGMSTYQEEGEIVSVSATEVVIAYRHREASVPKLTLNPRALASTDSDFEPGEKVQIYFSNFEGAVGAERSNGEAYPVMIIAE